MNNNDVSNIKIKKIIKYFLKLKINNIKVNYKINNNNNIDVIFNKLKKMKNNTDLNIITTS